MTLVITSSLLNVALPTSGANLRIGWKPVVEAFASLLGGVFRTISVPAPTIYAPEDCAHISADLRAYLVAGFQEMPRPIDEIDMLRATQWMLPQFHESAPASLFDRLFEIAGRDPIIGYEMPPSMLRAIDRSGKVFINLVLHPVRFGRDISISMTSNREGLFSALDEFAVHPSEAIIDAAYLKSIRSARLPVVRKSITNASVVVGQTLSIDAQKFTDLRDYMPKLVERLKSYDWIYIVPHPHQMISPIAEISLLQSLAEAGMGDRAEIRYTNTYALLAHDAVKSVLSVASSVGCEARRFFKDAHFLAADPEFSTIDIQRAKLVVGRHFADPALWHVLASRLNLEPETAGLSGFVLPPHALREMLDLHWGHLSAFAFDPDRVVQIAGHPTRRIVASAALDPSHPEHTQQAFRLLADADATPADIDWHARHRAVAGSDATIRLFMDDPGLQASGLRDLNSIAS